jgi:hypothetical protein
MQNESQLDSPIYNNYSDYRHKMSNRSNKYRQKRNLQLAEAQRLLNSTYISKSTRAIDICNREDVENKCSTQNQRNNNDDGNVVDVVCNQDM